MNIAGIITKAMTLGASDIHMAAGSKVLFRVCEQLISDETLNETLNPAMIETLVNEVLTMAQLEKLKSDKALVQACSLPNLGRFRLAISMQRGSYSIAIKMVQIPVQSLEQLQFHPVIEKLPGFKDGLVIFSGMAKSGRSTATAYVLHQINSQQAKNIVTIESPIEYLFKHDKSIVRQKEVGLDVNSHFEGLKATLREDADVIYIDQIPDLQTLELIFNAAEQGCLVLCTMTAKDVSSSLDALIDVFALDQRGRMRLQLAKILRAIIIQQPIQSVDMESKPMAHEILINNNAIKRLLIESKLSQIPLAMQSYKEMGMVTMEESLKALVTAELVDKESAYQYANHPKQFLELLNKA